MPNTSATGGYLTPTSTPPLNDDGLADFMHDVIVGVTGIANGNVRPAFQKNPPARPSHSVNWCGFRIDNQIPEAGGAYIEEKTGGAGATQQRHESFELACAFYGPNCRGYAQALRDNLEIQQNREFMYLAGMAFIDAGPLSQNAEQVHEEWYDRADIVLTFRRQLDRDYSILSFASANGTIHTETLTIAWAVSPEV